MFKTEAHTHTQPSSSCSRLTPRELVRLHKEAGYDTVILSDHFAAHHFKKLGETLTFAEKVGVIWNSYLEAKAEGERLGMVVLFSVELSLHGNHYLLYGVTQEFLCAREEIFDLPLDVFYAHAKANGITIIQAHPYRDGKCSPQPQYVDGFEIINTNPRHVNYTEQARQIAAEYSKPVTCGSDVHRIEDLGCSAILTEEKITSIEQYIDGLLNGRLTFDVKGDLT